ncbi:type II toxin-antitoxin system HicA family toxin [Pediococcus claussenii]|uniref:type II toxin-antitoxin system HicA family toxin n=1 Tax=Pediococcus claussenii TaxID=187452 RepID=UPI00081A4938|nr:type II toxin-antitoxin system HicA family toxin [Pediococcus claussenii]ANZ70364.1 toxin HicA [Pediococcus claussenii]ANZ72180.1 toxin HicA [Pediococcus claussenii]
MPIKTRDFEKLLKKNGFKAIRQAGSHKTYYNPSNRKQLVVPIHSREIPKGILNKMLKQAGLK